MFFVFHKRKVNLCVNLGLTNMEQVHFEEGQKMHNSKDGDLKFDGFF